MNNLIQESLHIPISNTVSVISMSPLRLAAQDRELEMRITAPVTGHDLPILLLSHGHGPSLYLSSKDGYGPFANFYAEHGFVVIQPTHANSKVAGLAAEAPGGPFFWRSRVLDMKLILDQFDALEASAPFIAGRLDRSRVAVAGHSLGAQTAGILLGALLTDTKDEGATKVSMSDPRIKAGLMLAAPGNGGDSLSEFARSNYTSLNPDYSTMTTPSLVVVGDSDVNPHLTVRGAEWHTDAYRYGPGSTHLLTMFGGKHGLGGIAGYDAKETDDENADRLTAVLRLTWSYLRSSLYAGDDSWARACKALKEQAGSLGRVDSK
jgi:hypothetical protein